MPPDISSLRADFVAGRRTPTQEVERFLAVSSEPQWASAWIHRLDAEQLLQRARELEALARADSGLIERLPLYGMLYAAKDNIDAAGVPTTAACPAFALLESLGGQPVEMDYSPLLEAAALLYDGPWVAERMTAIRLFVETHAQDMHEVVRTIISGGAKYSAVQVFQASTRLEALKKAVAPLWDRVETMVVPTTPTAYRIAEVLAEPYDTNRRLGYYTNFVNLLDMAALSVPVCLRADGLPAGVTLIGRAGSDPLLADLGQRLHHASGLTLGATGAPMPPPETRRRDLSAAGVPGSPRVP